MKIKLVTPYPIEYGGQRRVTHFCHSAWLRFLPDIYHIVYSCLNANLERLIISKKPNIFLKKLKTVKIGYRKAFNSIMRNVDVFVVPTRYEPFSPVILVAKENCNGVYMEGNCKEI